MSSPVPGWYPDTAPGAPSVLRWWDGRQWTEHVRGGGGPQTLAPRRHGPTTPDGQPLAGWWWRALAHIVDLVALWVVGFLATFPVQLGIQRQVGAHNAELQQRVARGEPFALTDF